MSVLGLLEVTPRAANADLITHLPQRIGGGFFAFVKESFAGAWQRNVTIDRQDVLTYGTVFSCITLVAGDIAKLWLKLVEQDADGICTEKESPAYSPVLRKPNHFSTRVKFFEYWIISKLTTGNTYVLKERDKRGFVSALYILDPSRVEVLIAPNGEVFYKLAADYLAGKQEPVTVPAREIIHDVCVPLFHPLIGVSPIYACGLAAMQGLKIQQNSARLFANGSNPGGVLTAPAAISEATAKRLQEHWEANYAGQQNIGKVAVLGDGLKYEPMVMTAVDAQLIEQLKWTAENICACFHVPGYMVGIGPAPPYTDIQSINLQYYTQALQNPIENLEVLLGEGLELPKRYAIEFDLKALARMDTKTQMAIARDGVSGGILTPNEGRADFDLKPVPGGNTPYLQQQMFSLEALAARDKAGPAPSTVTPPPAPAAPPPEPAPPKSIELQMTDDLIEDVAAAQLKRELAA